jgi:hypothetical protein
LSLDVEHDKKRVADGEGKTRDLEEEARQKAVVFEHFEIDYSVWYCANVVSTSENPYIKGVVLVHKPTNHPFVIMVNLATPPGFEPALDHTEYAFYTNELDATEGYVFALMSDANAETDGPVVIDATYATYMSLGALSPEDGHAHRVAMMYYLGMSMEQPDPRAAERMAQQRRVVKGARHVHAVQCGGDTGTGGMDIEDST